MGRPIVQQAVPVDSLLKNYRGTVRPDRWGTYGDCFAITIDRSVSLADFVLAFYTSWVFRLERAILRVVGGAPATDADARGVADGSAKHFALWYVGERTASELLMCDRMERTRSWFRVQPLEGNRTLLQFGSAVAASRDNRTGEMAIGGGFHALLRFHVWYSRALLGAAGASLMKQRTVG